MAICDRRSCRIYDDVRDSKIHWDIRSNFHRKIDSSKYGRAFPRSYEEDENTSFRRVGQKSQQSSTAWSDRRNTVREADKPYFRSILPTFDGSSSTLDFLDWIDCLQDYFDAMKPPDDLKCKLAASKLKGEAREWWEELQQHRFEEGKNLITSWPRMYKILIDKFLHTSRLTYFYERENESDEKNANCSMKCPLEAYSGSLGEICANTDTVTKSPNVDENILKHIEAKALSEVYEGENESHSMYCDVQGAFDIEVEELKLYGEAYGNQGFEDNNIMPTSNIINIPPSMENVGSLAGVELKLIEVDEVLEAEEEQGMAICLPKKVDGSDKISSYTEYRSFLFDPGILRACITVSVEVLFEAKLMAGETPLKNFDPGGKPIVDGNDISGHHVNEVWVPSVVMPEIAVSDQGAWVMYTVNCKHGPNPSRIGNKVGSKVQWVESEQNRRQTLWSSNDVDVLVNELLTLSFDPGGVTGRANTFSSLISKAEVTDVSSVECPKRKLLVTHVMEATSNLSSNMNQMNQIVGVYKAVTNPFVKFATILFDPGGVLWPIQTTSLSNDLTISVEFVSRLFDPGGSAESHNLVDRLSSSSDMPLLKSDTSKDEIGGPYSEKATFGLEVLYPNYMVHIFASLGLAPVWKFCTDKPIYKREVCIQHCLNSMKSAISALFVRCLSMTHVEAVISDKKLLAYTLEHVSRIWRADYTVNRSSTCFRYDGRRINSNNTGNHVQKRAFNANPPQSAPSYLILIDMMVILKFTHVQKQQAFASEFSALCRDGQPLFQLKNGTSIYSIVLRECRCALDEYIRTRGRVIRWEGWNDANDSKYQGTFSMARRSIVGKNGQNRKLLKLFSKTVNGLDPPAHMKAKMVGFVWTLESSLVDELLCGGMD